MDKTLNTPIASGDDDKELILFAHKSNMISSDAVIIGIRENNYGL